jgi:DNA-binding LacI/PurR family transcriptional regulator
MTKPAAQNELSRRLLYEQLAERLRELIREQRLWGGHLPPERELARTYGVSQDTVRRSLKVLAAEGLVVSRQGQGNRVLPRPPQAQTRRAAGVLVASSWGNVPPAYAAGILTGLGAGASDAGWRVSFANLSSAGAAREFLARLRDEKPDGLLFVSVSDRELVEQALRVRNAPSLVVDHHFEGLPVTSVRDDSRDSARQATRHLLELGHRRIAYLDRSVRTLNPWRHQGYDETLRDAGIEPDPALLASCPQGVEHGRRETARLLELAEPPTAIMTFDDTRGWGAWQAAEEAGLVVGRDFAVVGMGGQTYVPGLPVELTTLWINSEEMGRLAVRELGEMIAGRARPGREILWPVKLVIGRSSRDARVGPARKTGPGGSR